MAGVLVWKYKGNELRENILAQPRVHLGGSVGREVVCRAGDPGLNPSPGENAFS